MVRFVRDYSLSLTLAVFFTASWLIQTIGGWREFEADQLAHGQLATLGGDGGYVWTWLEATFENWQSEFLQLFTFVVLTVFLIHRESHESRDGQDQMTRQLEEIVMRLRTMESAIQGAQGVTSVTAQSPVHLERSVERPAHVLSTPRGALVYFAGVIFLGLVLNLGTLYLVAG